MTSSVSPDVAAVQAALAKALHETETSGGWWGHPECEEFGRLIAPLLAPLFAADARAQALRDAADDIQALHPGEVKNSVVWLRERADRLAALNPGAETEEKTDD